MKTSLNFSDCNGNETDNIQLIVHDNCIEFLEGSHFKGTLDELYKEHGLFVETGTVGLPKGNEYPPGGIFTQKELFNFLGIKKEQPAPKTCFVLRKNKDGVKKLVYIGKMTSIIRKRAQAHANQTKCHVALFFNGKDPQVFKPATA